MGSRKSFVLLCGLVLAGIMHAQQAVQPDEPTRRLAHDIFKQLIEINTTDSVGSVTAASEVMAQRFRDAGFAESDIHVLGPNDRKKNVVVRLRGSGKHKPVLLIGHLDVVEARREDWTKAESEVLRTSILAPLWKVRQDFQPNDLQSIDPQSTEM